MPIDESHESVCGRSSSAKKADLDSESQRNGAVNGHGAGIWICGGIRSRDSIRIWGPGSPDSTEPDNTNA
jgi:hypothetical protein